MSAYSREQMAYAQKLLEHCSARRMALPQMVFDAHDKAVAEVEGFLKLSFWWRIKWLLCGERVWEKP